MDVNLEADKQSNPAPIALFVYNRPRHAQATVDALRANALANESDLFVFSDAPKNDGGTADVAAVRAYLRSIVGFKTVTIVERATNLGVDPSVIDGVTTLCEKFGRVIVVEDDLVTSPWFLTYMNRALTVYQNDESVMQVSGFMFPIQGFATREACFLPYSTCWGWATWDRAWKHFDLNADGYAVLERDPKRRNAFNLNGAYDYFSLLAGYMNGNTSAWDIRWYLTVFSRGGIALFPKRSLVRNIGFDGSGVHCQPSDQITDDLSFEEVADFPAVKKVDRAVWVAVEKYLKSRKERSFMSAMRRLVRIGRPIAS